MKKLWVIIRKEYRGVVRTKGFAIGTLLTPLIMGAMIFLPAILASRGESKGESVGVLEVESRYLEPLASVLTADTLADGTPRWNIDYVSLPSTDTAVMMARWSQAALDKELDAFIVADSTLMQGGEVSYYATNVSRMTLFRDLRSELTDFVVGVRLERVGLDAAMAESLTTRVTLEPHKIGAEGQSKADFLSDYFAGLIFTMVLLMVVIGYGNTLMRSVITEKTSRIVEVLVSSVKPLHIMGGKIIGLGAASLTQVAIWVVMGAALSISGFAMMGGTSSIFSLGFAGWFAVFLTLAFLFFACLFALIGAISPTDQEAQQFVGPITMVLIMPIVIEFAIIEDPSALWVRLLSMIPPFSPGIMLMRMTFSPIDLWEPILSASILMLATLGVAWFSSRVFRIGILMTGKRPTVPEILKWVRYK